MKKKHKQILRQSGVLPYQYKNGTLHVLLVTTTSGQDWIIPKGKIEKGLTASESALKEAVEEAGVQGMITGGSIGSYRFKKKKTGRICRVEVFPMKVEQEMTEWEEEGKRKRCWYPLREAAARVSNTELQELILNAAEKISGSDG
jgi:8-oxo-dGTP pyrophosphatase MutT (NUDIX family)